MKTKKPRKIFQKSISLLLSVLMVLSSILLTGGSTANAAIVDMIENGLVGGTNYRADYSSLTEVEDAAAALNLQLQAEGSVLLKNDDAALPLTGSPVAPVKVTVLGATADTLATGGSGSGSQAQPGGDNTPAVPLTLFESLDAAGIEYNPAVKAEYEKPENAPKTLAYSGNTYDGGHYMNKSASAGAGAVEFDGGYYTAADDGMLTDDMLAGYTDTALVVISRSGAEGQDNDPYDLKDRTSSEAVTDNMDDHYLQLTTSEKELMAYAKAHFGKVIVLLNSPSVMEMGCLQNDDGIDAILWIGQPGWNGIMAVGGLLTGEYNPSGRTVDFWMSDFATDPTWYNFGDYRQANVILNGQTKGEKSAVAMGYDAAYATDGINNGNYVVVDYAEGIYLGYKYYETVYAELLKAAGQDAADAWYAKAAVYPFGYGLSYTTFTQKIASVEGDLSNPDGTVTVTVTVQNTGSAAGKEVVQLYSTPPYTPGGIEKADVNLVAFDKTRLLAPNESETVKLTVAVKDLASFDYNDANGNGKEGYELEPGSYTLSLRADSHNVLDSTTLSAQSLLTWDEDGNPDTPNNIFSQVDEDSVWARYNTQSNAWVVGGQDFYLKRGQLVVGSGSSAVPALEESYTAGSPNELQTQLGWLLAGNGAKNLFTKEAFYALGIQEEYGALYQDKDNALTTSVETDFDNPWAVSSVPEGWTQGTGRVNELGMYAIELADMTGVPLDDPRWTTFMNQLTLDELLQICNDGGYGSAELKTIGKPAIEDHDGPGQLAAVWSKLPTGNGYAWACESVIGSTWNKALCEEQGRIIGNESILLGVTGWYGPGMNIHRSPLSGRNFEYYSQDGVHGGWILASVVKGATSKGTHVYMKHAFLNDQETSRSGVCTFATEQAIREIYARPFEIAIQQGNGNGLMLSFNRIGIQTSASYAINVQMYTNEWGYDGISVTDAFYAGSGWTPENLIRSYTMPLNSRFLAFPPLQLPGGTWNPELNGGRGGVECVAGDSETPVESPTQWYWARMTAQRALYTYANSNAMTGLKTSMLLKSKVVSLQQNGKYSGTTVYSTSEISAFTAQMNEVYGRGNYEVIVTNAPAGLAVGTATGMLEGSTPAAPGVYPIDLTVKGKGNLQGITGTSTLTLSVSAPVQTQNVRVKFAGFTNLTAADMATEYEVMGAMTKLCAQNEGKYTEAKFTAEGLPEGLTINELTGEITGSIRDPEATLGKTYEITLTQDLKQVEDGFLGWIWAERVTSQTAKVYLTVANMKSYNVNIEGAGTAQAVCTGSTIADIVPPASRDGYDFTGWSATRGGTILAGTDAIPGTLYANWEYNPIKIANGTFWINSKDTGVSAAGERGPAGAQGVDGIGITGVTAEEGNNETIIVFTLSDGTTQRIAVPSGVGVPGEEGPMGKPGKNGRDANGAIAIAALVIALLAVVGLVTLVAFKFHVVNKHKDDDQPAKPDKKEEAAAGAKE